MLVKGFNAKSIKYGFGKPEFNSDIATVSFSTYGNINSRYLVFNPHGIPSIRLYLSPDGDDNNSGLTPDSPLFSIEGIRKVIGVGDKGGLFVYLILAPGSYSPFVFDFVTNVKIYFYSYSVSEHYVSTDIGNFISYNGTCLVDNSGISSYQVELSGLIIGSGVSVYFNSTNFGVWDDDYTYNWLAFKFNMRQGNRFFGDYNSYFENDVGGIYFDIPDGRNYFESLGFVRLGAFKVVGINDGDVWNVLVNMNSYGTNAELVLAYWCRSSGDGCVGRIVNEEIENVHFIADTISYLFKGWEGAKFSVDISRYSHIGNSKIIVDKQIYGYVVVGSRNNLLEDYSDLRLFPLDVRAVDDNYSVYFGEPNYHFNETYILKRLPSSTSQPDGLYYDENGFVKINKS